jgi:hypothetical protein
VGGHSATTLPLIAIVWLDGMRSGAELFDSDISERKGARFGPLFQLVT